MTELMSSASAYPHLHDVRATHDLARLRYDALTGAEEGAWAILQLIPGPSSGAATLLGASTDVATGKLIDDATGQEMPPDRVRKGVIEEGRWERREALRGSVEPRGQYAWTDPAEVHVRGLRVEHLYPPFSFGGVVLCRYLPAVQGSAQFQSVQLVPPDWPAAIRSGYETFTVEPRLWTEPPTPPRADQLRSLAYADHPVLAVMALRTLLQDASIELEMLADILGRFAGYRRAVLVYLMMLWPRGGDDDAVAAMSKAMAGIDSPEAGRSFALGIVTARLLHPQLRGPERLAPDLVAALRADQDPYLQQLLGLVGLV